LKTIYVYNDVHLFGVHALDNIKIRTTTSDYHLGDIVDMKGCKKKDIQKAREYMEELKKSSSHYLSGNHELDQDPETFFHADDGILYTHGDYLVYGDEKADAWRAKTPGRGKWMRFGLRLIYPFRKFKKLKISEAFKVRCAKKAKEMDCHTVIMGHRHPNKLVDICYMGVRIMILPRGKNTLQIPSGEGLLQIGDEVKHIKRELK